MAELIAATILLGSLSGIIVILSRKIPVLAELTLPKEKTSLVEKTKKNFKKLNFFQTPSFDNFLEKLLRRSKILTLKTENKISGYLERLRQKNANDDKDNYWQELKNSVRPKTKKTRKTKKK